jgi:indolepyruvate ferredoxin oxidoreductase beta subunit
MARLKPWRRRTFRFADEQAQIARWLDAIADARDVDAAVEIAGCARLLKGYGETHRRGLHNFNRIFAALVDRFAGAAAIRRAREAALADPEGDALDKALAALVASPSPSHGLSAVGPSLSQGRGDSTSPSGEVARVARG